jgi:hypothetical protein
VRLDQPRRQFVSVLETVWIVDGANQAVAITGAISRSSGSRESFAASQHLYGTAQRITQFGAMVLRYRYEPRNELAY